MKKQILSFLLTAVLCAQSAAPAMAYKSDIDGHWAEESFKRLESMSIINGYDDGFYRPEEKITRAEFFAVVNRICNASKNKGSSFSDIAAGAWYKNAVDYAYTAGYASGYEDGTFRPDMYITRAEAAAAICGAFGGDVGNDVDFTDKTDIPDWAAEGVKTLVTAGYFSGYEDGTFRPGACITRAETAAVFDRLAGELYTTSGEISDASFGKNLIVGASDIIFRNTAFDGDVYLSAGISGGEIRFVNCSIGGNVIFAGRDNASLVFENTDCKKAVVSSNGHTGIIATGSSVISELSVRSECDVWEMNTDKGFENLRIYTPASVSGNVGKIEVIDGTGFVLTGGAIEECVVTSLSRPKLDINGKIGLFTADAGCTLNGTNISAGYKRENAGSEKNGDIQYSYTLSRLNNDDFESEPIIGGSRTEVQQDKSYTLDGLTLSAGTLMPEFSPEITSYSVAVPNSTGSLRIVPETSGQLECRVGAKTIGASGYTADSFADTSQTVNIDVYGGLAKRNTYTVTITGYGTSDTGISEISLDVPYECRVSSDGLSYDIEITGDISYSNDSIPVTLTVKTVNDKSAAEINGSAGKTYTLDLFEKRKVNTEIIVTSEDKTKTQAYSVTVTRPIIPEIDNPDSSVTDRLISDPSSMTAEDLVKVKISDINEDNLEQYKGYLAQTVYKAEGGDVFKKQEIIQNAVRVVNEWKGKKLRIEAEDFWTGTINEFADDSSQKYCLGIKNFGISLNSSEVPEGTYNMTVRWGNKFECKADGNPILVNGVTVYNGAIPKTWLNSAVTNKTLKTTQLADTVINGIALKDGDNTVTFTEQGSNLVLDYFELEMVF